MEWLKINTLLITGELNVKLNNLFKSGKQLQIQWKKYLKNSQKLNLSSTLLLFGAKPIMPSN